VSSVAAIWHEVECGGYEADMALWERLAARYPGPVLDVGSGTGRVALRLATAGASVVALDRDAALLAVLEERAGQVAAGKVTAIAGDARKFVSEERFGLVIVAMQTIQLFGGAGERLRFLRCARGNVAPGGCVAIALADLGRDAAQGPVSFAPDVMEVGDERFTSRPVSVHLDPDEVVIQRERVRTVSGGAVERSVSREAIDRVSPGQVIAEAREAGFETASLERVPATGSYAGAQVVLLDG